jgi:hypothetical protein
VPDSGLSACFARIGFPYLRLKTFLASPVGRPVAAWRAHRAADNSLAAQDFTPRTIERSKATERLCCSGDGRARKPILPLLSS